MKKNLDPEYKMLADIAEEDLQAFRALVHTEIALPIVCFHGQQTIEKYMNALLGKRKIPFPFTHDLIKLHQLLADNGLKISVDIELLEKLNPFAVKQRYDRPPQVHITRKEAQDIVDSVTE